MFSKLSNRAEPLFTVRANMVARFRFGLMSFQANVINESRPAIGTSVRVREIRIQCFSRLIFLTTATLNEFKVYRK